MRTLFTLNKSWHDSTWLFEQLLFASTGDSILLIEDAVLGVGSPITLASFLAKCKALGVSVFALEEDANLRGINNHFEEIRMIDYTGFVGLVTVHDKQVAW